MAWKGAGEISDSNKVLVIDTYLFFLAKMTKHSSLDHYSNIFGIF